MACGASSRKAGPGRPDAFAFREAVAIPARTSGKMAFAENNCSTPGRIRTSNQPGGSEDGPAVNGSRTYRRDDTGDPGDDVFGFLGRLPFLIIAMAAGMTGVNPGGPECVTPAEAAIEQEAFQLFNAERVKAGLPPCRLDADLRDLARLHSRHMRDKAFFAHVDLNGLDPMGRKDQYCPHLFVETIGENIATASGGDPSGVAGELMKSWLASAGHRRNIMNPQYTCSGIGVQGTAGHRYYATQVFARPVVKLLNPLPANVRTGQEIIIELLYLDEAPVNTFRLVIFYPDEKARFLNPDGSFFTGKGYYAPDWKGERGTVRFRCDKGRGEYRLVPGRMGKHFRNWLSFATD